jgi:HEAT repeat protein
MKIKRWRLLLGFGACLVLAALSPASRWPLVRLLNNERSYRGRPTSYWSQQVLLYLADPDDYRRGKFAWLDPVRHALGWDSGASTEQPFGNLADPNGVPVLTELLVDEDRRVRCYAATSLAFIGCPAHSAFPALAHMLVTDPDLDSRREAGRALAWDSVSLRETGQAPSKATVQDLIAALRDDDDTVNYFAAWALGEVGPDAKQAVPALLELLRAKGSRTHEELDVWQFRDNIVNALRDIEPDAAKEAIVLVEGQARGH